MSPFAFPLLRGAALVGGVALLLADAAAPFCASIPFDTIYAIETDCGAGGSEVVRIRADETLTRGNATVEHLEGDTLITSVVLSGTCEEDDDPLKVESIIFKLATPATGINVTISCYSALGGHSLLL